MKNKNSLTVQPLVRLPYFTNLFHEFILWIHFTNSFYEFILRIYFTKDNTLYWVLVLILSFPEYQLRDNTVFGYFSDRPHDDRHCYSRHDSWRPHKLRQETKRIRSPCEDKTITGCSQRLQFQYRSAFWSMVSLHRRSWR